MQAIHSLLASTLLSATFFIPGQEQNNQFLGTWEAHSNGELFKITLVNKPDYKGPDGKLYNVILGKHTYNRGARVVEQSLTSQDYPLFGVPTTSNVLQLGYQDLTLKKRGRVTLTLLPNNQLRWQLTTSAETITINRANPIKPGFTVPTDITLRRAK
jgi:hypothetical protein